MGSAAFPPADPHPPAPGCRLVAPWFHTYAGPAPPGGELEREEESPSIRNEAKYYERRRGEIEAQTKSKRLWAAIGFGSGLGLGTVADILQVLQFLSALF